MDDVRGVWDGRGRRTTTLNKQEDQQQRKGEGVESDYNESER